MKQKPINLNLLTIRFPITAIVSILHRISGVFLFFLIPLLLWSLEESLSSPTGFLNIAATIQSPVCKGLVFLGLSALVYHLIAGLRHLLMDCGIGETKTAGKQTSYLVLILTALMVLALGTCLW